MNAHSAMGKLSSGKALFQIGDEVGVVRRAHAALYDLEDLLARQRRGDGVDVQVEMRRGDAELHQRGALRFRRFEQGPLDAVVDDGEVDKLVEGEVGDVLDVRPPHDHGVAAHAPVVVQKDPDAVVFEDDLAGPPRRAAEDAGHAVTIIARRCEHSASAARTRKSPPSRSARGATAARTRTRACRSAGAATTTISRSKRWSRRTAAESRIGTRPTRTAAATRRR